MKNLEKLQNLYKNATDVENIEIGNLSFDEFVEFETNLWNVEKFYNPNISFDEYIIWAIENFEKW